jgi:hypothetical protein
MEPGEWARKALDIIENETRDLIHVGPPLGGKTSRSRIASAMNLIDDVLPWVVLLLGLSLPMLAITVLS